MSLPQNCPLCKANSSKQRVVSPHVYGRESGESAFFCCENCKVIYQYPQLSKEEEKLFYKEEFEIFMNKRSGFENGWEIPENHVQSNKENFKRRHKFIKKYLNDVENILEFGCSSGFMLFPFQKLGKDCYGIEPSGLFNEFVNSKGIKVFSSLEECKKI